MIKDRSISELNLQVKTLSESNQSLINELNRKNKLLDMACNRIAELEAVEKNLKNQVLDLDNSLSVLG